MAWRPIYATVPEMKEFIRIHDNVDDNTMAAKLETASRDVDKRANRQFGRVDAVEARVYPIGYDRWEFRHWARIDDLMTTDDLTVEIDGIAVTGYTLEPTNAPADGWPWTEIVLPTGGRRVRITAWWGWSEIPVPIKEATMYQANRLLERPKSPYGTAGTPADGSQLRLSSRIDVDADRIAGSYWRAWGAA